MVFADLVPLPRDARRDVQHDRDHRHAVAAGERDQRTPGVRPDVGGIDHGQAARAEPPRGNEMDRIECVLGRSLVGLIVGDQAPEEVGGEHLGRAEVAAREGRLARAGGAHEHDQRGLGEVDTPLIGALQRAHGGTLRRP
jgi:hypothetical protein